ncbi:PREDICTED: secretion-regulating guanine nucleotide exchange factor [Ceratosolen solmsi marchali]|uniref:Secretion-regulating guanine nucleotide exchange factor n=1 Tax=Ceratosolen solmsi marchali TaxID=326594 RepID=A0AAJ6YV35_9HYME|nr:PREDICTED: secretion-regulating guanine nucleotide exchange factor [Ceratosolen solmsi marchali]
MPDYRLFSWGANSHGQLGLGDFNKDELTIAEEVCLTSVNLKVEHVKKIVGGAGHTLLLDKFGGVYSCGWNDKGQTGLKNATSRFQKLDGFDGERIVDVACGWDSSMAVTDNGDCFVWGSNTYGQLGLNSITIGTKIEKPLKLKLNSAVKGISMGLRHSAFITRDSRLFVSGAATKGQLGINVHGVRFSDSFSEVSDLQPVKHVSCGQHYTAVITATNEVFAWGDNKYGQLGIDPSLHKRTLRPIKIENIDGCNKIYCGWTHSIILTNDKKVLCWGRNSYGQLGRSKSTSTTEFWKPKAALASITINQLSVGSEHNIALADDGSILSWGWNEHGNCGNGSTNDIFVPTKVNVPNGSAVMVGAGAGHSFAIIKTDH